MIWFKPPDDRLWHYLNIRTKLLDLISVALDCPGYDRNSPVRIAICDTSDDVPLPPDHRVCWNCFDKWADSLRMELNLRSTKSHIKARVDALLAYQLDNLGQNYMSPSDLPDRMKDTREGQIHLARYLTPVEQKQAKDLEGIENRIRFARQRHQEHEAYFTDSETTTISIRNGTVRPGLVVALRFPEEPDAEPEEYYFQGVYGNGEDVNPHLIPPPGIGTVKTTDPLGKALIGRRTGELFEYTVNGNQVQCMVVRLTAVPSKRQISALNEGPGPSIAKEESGIFDGRGRQGGTDSKRKAARILWEGDAGDRDGSKEIGYFARDFSTGGWGSFPGHDDYGDEADP